MNTNETIRAKFSSYLQKQENASDDVKKLFDILENSPEKFTEVWNRVVSESYQEEYGNIPGCEDLVKECTELTVKLSTMKNKEEIEATQKRLEEIGEELRKKKAEHEKPIEFDNSWMTDFFSPKENSDNGGTSN